MLLLDLLLQKYSFSKIRKWIIFICTVAILFFGIYDQTSATHASFVPDYKNIKEEFLHDNRFITNIETRFPDDTMIFQLPYAALGAGPPAGMGQYDHWRAYLHSKKIHWSYGVYINRAGDLWQREITSKPPDEMIAGLSFAGFDGIYLNSDGYADKGKKVISSISSILNETPLVSDNGRLYFFDTTQYNSHLKAQFTSDEFEKQKNKILDYLTVEWQDGFWPLEGTGGNNWRWCSAQGTLILNNSSNKDKIFTINATFNTGYPELSNLKIESGLIAENLKINSSGYYYKKEVIIPPGRYVIRFSCDAKRVDAPGDPRYLVFGTRNFQMVESK
jgi:phosphoglycerol transferase